jgi:hypothetical protein
MEVLDAHVQLRREMQAFMWIYFMIEAVTVLQHRTLIIMLIIG